MPQAGFELATYSYIAETTTTAVPAELFVLCMDGMQLKFSLH